MKLLFIIPIALLAAAEAHAQTFAIQQLLGGTEVAPPDNSTYGWSFTVDSPVPISVSQLGLWDAGGDGFTDSHTVGIWNSSDQLIAQASFGPGATGTFDTGFRYLSITPVPLQDGQSYTIGSWNQPLGTSDLGFEGTSVATATAIVYGGPRKAPTDGSGFVAPTQTYSPGGDAFFGPTFTVVPEPGTYAAITALALAGYAVARRRFAPRA